jgi:uncharacterized Zn finger protein
MTALAPVVPASPVVRLAPCPQCSDRRRTLVDSAEGLRGHCLGCGQVLTAPLATQTVQVSSRT